MYEGVIQHLIDELGRLPGVGPKGAQRIAFYLLAADAEDVRRLAAALIEVTVRERGRRRTVPDLPGHQA
jgi:recombination protein RecR